jgi:Zn-dependent protease
LFLLFMGGRAASSRRSPDQPPRIRQAGICLAGHLALLCLWAQAHPGGRGNLPFDDCLDYQIHEVQAPVLVLLFLAVLAFRRTSHPAPRLAMAGLGALNLVLAVQQHWGEGLFFQVPGDPSREAVKAGAPGPG